ncbi:unnamed protein product, partial [Ectocarpus sp. 12 AP-2014]
RAQRVQILCRVQPTCACVPHRTNKGRARVTCVGLWASTLAAMNENGSTETMDVDTPGLESTLTGGTAAHPEKE